VGVTIHISLRTFRDNSISSSGGFFWGLGKVIGLLSSFGVNSQKRFNMISIEHIEHSAFIYLIKRSILFLIEFFFPRLKRLLGLLNLYPSSQKYSSSTNINQYLSLIENFHF
jgi:hypothetical protein